MSAQFFPNVEQILDILFSELPDGPYASDRGDNVDVNKRSYSSTELRAHAQVFANLYSNLSTINQDKFITTVTPFGLSSWENELFKDKQDGSQPYITRQSNLYSKRRATGRISLPGVSDVISGILTPLGLPFEILPFCGQFNGLINGAWILEVSPLGESTYLSLRDPLYGAQNDLTHTPLDCSLDYVAAGITAQDLIDIQTTAYEYQVLIFGDASAETLALLDKRLTEVEPARSTHIIVNNAVPTGGADVLDLGAFLGSTLEDAIYCSDFLSAPPTFNVWDCGGF